MGDLDRGDAKQRIRSTGAVKDEKLGFVEPFGSSFAAIAAPPSDSDSVATGDVADSAGRSVPVPVPIVLDDFQPSGGDFEVPYQIRRKKSGYMIYLPEGCLSVDGEDVPVSKFSGVSKESGMKGPWYSYPFTQLLAGYLNVKVEVDLENGTSTVKEVEFSNGSPAPSGGESSSSGKKTKTYSVAITKTDSYKRPVQVVASAIRITSANAKPDGKSVDNDEENDAKLQLYKFSGTDANGNPGLVQRIQASFDDKSKTVTLSSTESELMLVGRKGGKIVYIPLSEESQSGGSGEDPSAESQEEVDEPDPENIDPATPGAKDPTGDPGSSNPGSDDCGGGGVSPGGIIGGGGGGNKFGYSGCGDC